jgi:hypothetical protein
MILSQTSADLIYVMAENMSHKIKCFGEMELNGSLTQTGVPLNFNKVQE